MYYNTELFGAKVRFIRTKLKLTQKEVADQAGINISTMRRIESGKVIPKLETLEYLSPILKEDLHLLFMQYRIDNYDTFYNLKTRLENKLDNVDIDSLEPDLQELAALKSASKNIYYQNTINQLIFLVSAVISHKKEDDPAGALEQLITAMRITTPAFALEDFKAFVYSEMELRVLMNIAFALNSLGNTKLHLGILNLCGEMVNAHNPLYPKILYNLAGAFMQDKDFVTALDYNEQAISWCQRNRTYAGLALMLYNKGLCQYYLRAGDFIDPIKKAIFLCDIYGQTTLKMVILNSAQKLLGAQKDMLLV